MRAMVILITLPDSRSTTSFHGRKNIVSRRRRSPRAVFKLYSFAAPQLAATTGTGICVILVSRICQ